MAAGRLGAARECIYEERKTTPYWKKGAAPRATGDVVRARAKPYSVTCCKLRPGDQCYVRTRRVIREKSLNPSGGRGERKSCSTTSQKQVKKGGLVLLLECFPVKKCRTYLLCANQIFGTISAPIYTYILHRTRTPCPNKEAMQRQVALPAASDNFLTW